MSFFRVKTEDEIVNNSEKTYLQAHKIALLALAKDILIHGSLNSEESLYLAEEFFLDARKRGYLRPANFMFQEITVTLKTSSTAPMRSSSFGTRTRLA